MSAVNYVLRDIENLRRNWIWFLLLGIALAVIGIVAIGAPLAATLSTMLFLGWLLFFSGVLQIVHAFWAKQWGGFFVQILVGVLQLVVGGLMIERPLTAGAESLTLLMAVFFVVGGIFRMFAAVALPFDGRVWLFLGGLINLVLGVMIWKRWPGDSIWVIGLFVGIDLLMHGLWLVTLAISIKAMPTTTTT
jgi:uncharacterized membrane protein HdeD (DUF308 family)